MYKCVLQGYHVSVIKDQLWFEPAQHSGFLWFFFLACTLASEYISKWVSYRTNVLQPIWQQLEANCIEEMITFIYIHSEENNPHKN